MHCDNSVNGAKQRKKCRQWYIKFPEMLSRKKETYRFLTKIRFHFQPFNVFFQKRLIRFVKN